VANQVVKNTGMLGVVRAAKDTVIRFAMNQQNLEDDAIAGDTILKVPQTRKFFEGETIVVRDNTIGEIRHIKKIIDENTIEITEPLQATWIANDMNNVAMVQKAPGGQYVKRVYLGDPDNIPDYPAITVLGNSRDEDWWTVGSTTPDWRVTVSVLFDDYSTETAYEGMLELTASIENSLWANRWPVLDTIVETDLVADLNKGETVVQVDDTSLLQPNSMVMIEDLTSTEMMKVKRVIGPDSIELKNPSGCDFTVADGATVIFPSRWVMWSKPGSTDYGFVHKGTLLKASQITWDLQEEIVRYFEFTGPVKL